MFPTGTMKSVLASLSTLEINILDRQTYGSHHAPRSSCSSHYSVSFGGGSGLEGHVGVAVSSLMNGLSWAKKGPLSKLQCKKSFPVFMLLVRALSSVPGNRASGSLPPSDFSGWGCIRNGDAERTTCKNMASTEG